MTHMPTPGDEAGLRITMVSDNNGDQSDPTQFVEFRLTE